MRALEKRDEDKLKNEDAKNTFETIIYAFRGWLNDDDNSAYVEEKDKDAHLETTQKEEDWLYEDGSDAGYKVYQERTYDMKSKFSKLKNRRQSFTEREAIVPKVFDGLKKWKDTIDDVTASKPWITEGEKKDVLDKLSEMSKWLEEKVAAQAKKKLNEDPAFTGSEVESRFKPVQKLYKKTISKRAPKPAKEEKKEDDKDEKSEDKDKKDDKEEKKEEKTEDKKKSDL